MARQPDGPRENGDGTAPEGQGHQGPYARTFDRRRRDILTTAWAMIAEHGGDDFRLTELSRRSGVSLRTIYNAFADKDGVIAQAVAMHYHGLFDDIRPAADDSRNLRETMIMCARIGDEVARVRAFSATAARMYFSPRPNPTLVETLRSLPISLLRAWCRSDEADRRVIRQFGRQDMERSFANMQWGLVHDWINGRLDQQDLPRAFQGHMIFVALSFGNRAGRGEAKKLMKELA